MKSFYAVILILTSISAKAEIDVYKNAAGCTVERERIQDSIILHVSNGNQAEFVSYGYDYSFATFAYCDQSAVNINYYEGSAGTGIMISCSEHQNDHAVTRGRVDIEIKNNQLENVTIDGQVKKLFGWKQDAKIECLGLEKQ